MRPIALAALAASAALPAAAQDAPILPAFDAAAFATPGENLWHPLVPGTVRVFEGTDAEGVVSRDRVTVMPPGSGPVLLGVRTVAILDEEWEDGLLTERAFDYFAVDASGTVWQMGEDVTNFRYDEAGALTGTDAEGTWLAGVNGAAPGIVLPADPAPGEAVFKEHAPADEAMNYVRVAATGLALDAPGGPYADVVQVFESSTLEPEEREFKYFAPGVGLVRTEDGLDEELANPEAVSDLVP